MASSHENDPVDDFLASARESIANGRVPQRILNDERLHERELERVFGRCWVYVGHESEIPEPGDYARRYVGSDPFIFVRSEAGDIEVLFDSCRHRGTTVCRADQGNASHFRCPYHGWTYDNSGDLVGLPHKDACYRDIDTEEWGLLSAPQVTNYEGFVFASLDPDAPSFEEYLGDYRWYLDMHAKLPEEGWEAYAEPHRWTVEANWKMGAENFGGDDYHLFIAHQSSVETGFAEGKPYTTGSTEHVGAAQRYHAVTGGHMQIMGLVEEEHSPFFGHTDAVVETFSPDRLSDEQWNLVRRGADFVGTLFPNTSLMQISTSHESNDAAFFNVRKFRPLGPDRMEIVSWVLVPTAAPEADKKRMYDAAKTTFSPAGAFEHDDVAIWEWLTEAAGTTFARTADTHLNYEMGMEGMSDTRRVDDEFPGPGMVNDSPWEEGYGRHMYSHWCDLMLTERPDPLPLESGVK
jgi:phenylpropionate dioxygenase-like ring-hydroxylating dioxygenase large terminal subunit